MIDIDGWTRAWGNTQLVKAPRLDTRIPRAASEFLVAFGLPRRVIVEGPDPFEIDFDPVTKELVPYSLTIHFGDDDAAEQLRNEWMSQLVFGEEEFCNGGAAWCIHCDTGIIGRFDCELANPVQIANSDIQKFGRSVLAALDWSSENARMGRRDGPSLLTALAETLARIDPVTFSSPKNFWPSLLDHLIEHADEIEITADLSRSKPRF